MKVIRIAVVGVLLAAYPVLAADSDKSNSKTVKDICIALDTQLEETFVSIDLMEQDPTAIYQVVVPYETVEELKEIVRVRLERIKLLMGMFDENVGLWNQLDCESLLKK